jgi:uncharacterized protein (UPF0332 family)
MAELSAEEKITLSDLRAEKSREALSDAINNFNAGMYKTSVNRSYYAVLHSTRSLLILKGIDPSRHEGVKTMLGLHFIRTNLLPKEMIEIFKELTVLRTDVDYGDMEFIGKDEAEKALHRAKRFVEIAEGLRKEMIKELLKANN